MSFLQLFWFCIIGFLFSAFLVMDGFDFGVGMSTRLLGYNDKEADYFLSTIGPHWDGNEVWLIAAGGSMFAAFPLWYASLFSGFYILFLFILVALIFRGVSFEFKTASETSKGKNFWIWVNFFSSLVTPFLLGMLFCNLLQRLPIMDSKGNIFPNFFTIVNPLSLLGGVALTALCLIQGLHYLSLRTEGFTQYHAAIFATDIYFVVYPVEVLFAILLFFYTDIYKVHLFMALIILLLLVLSTIWGQIASATDKFVQAFLASSSSLILLVVLVFTGLFPYVLLSIVPKYSLLIKVASSSPYTLVVMTIVLVILIPFLLGYIFWSYFIDRKPINFKEFLKSSDSY